MAGTISTGERPTDATTRFAEIDRYGVTYAEWVAASGETGSSDTELSFVDPDRTVESYHGSLGQDASLESFIEEAMKQTKYHWREEYTANAVNAYIRAGFEL